MGVCKCLGVCGFMKSSQLALQRGSTVKMRRGRGELVAGPGAVFTAALKQHCATSGGGVSTLWDAEHEKG